MNCLHFVFKNGEDIIYDANLKYSLENDFLSFAPENFTIKMRLKNFYFLREDDSSKFEIIGDDNPISFLTLKEENMKFDVEVLYFEYKILQDKYIIKYKIESDLDKIKTIILELH